ncbi:hypothetical protein [Defluviitoga tunisiensis]|uniref:hypothetical protein n=1 Tax=Defluviitoga tunisiensis TaxID=1006576 RepID=UPI001E3721B8|nr:hypothetical protein [Defluviitoga tunisiensis]
MEVLAIGTLYKAYLPAESVVPETLPDFTVTPDNGRPVVASVTVPPTVAVLPPNKPLKSNGVHALKINTSETSNNAIYLTLFFMITSSLFFEVTEIIKKGSKKNLKQEKGKERSYHILRKLNLFYKIRYLF